MNWKWIGFTLMGLGIVGIIGAGYHEAHPSYTFDNLDDWAHGGLTGKPAFDQRLAMTVSAQKDGTASVDLGDLDKTRCRAALDAWGGTPSRVDGVQVAGWGKRTPIAPAEDMCRYKTNRVIVYLTPEEFAKVQAREIITREVAEASK